MVCTQKLLSAFSSTWEPAFVNALIIMKMSQGSHNNLNVHQVDNTDIQNCGQCQAGFIRESSFQCQSGWMLKGMWIEYWAGIKQLYPLVILTGQNNFSILITLDKKITVNIIRSMKFFVCVLTNSHATINTCTAEQWYKQHFYRGTNPQFHL